MHVVKPRPKQPEMTAQTNVLSSLGPRHKQPDHVPSSLTMSTFLGGTYHGGDHTKLQKVAIFKRTIKGNEICLRGQTNRKRHQKTRKGTTHLMGGTTTLKKPFRNPDKPSKKTTIKKPLKNH